MKMTVAIFALLIVGFAGSVATAAEATRVAVANPARIFNDMQELKDLRLKMDSEKKLLEGVDAEKGQKIQALQAELTALRPDAPQYQEKSSELLKARIEYETWGRLNNENFAREQKLQLKQVYLKIEQAIAEVAKQKGYDLVISDQRSELPENLDRLNMEQLRAIINARTVLYATGGVDISNDALALLDAKYRGAAKPQP